MIAVAGFHSNDMMLVEKTTHFTDAQARERETSKRMAAIGGEMGERDGWLPRHWHARPAGDALKLPHSQELKFRERFRILSV